MTRFKIEHIDVRAPRSVTQYPREAHQGRQAHLWRGRTRCRTEGHWATFWKLP